MSNFQGIISKLKKLPDRQRNDEVILIDSMNLFIRNFVAVRAMNLEGQHIGGILGFLRSLGYIIRVNNPTRVICIFDGKGGTSARKNMNPKYKANRNHSKILKWEVHDDIAQEKESIIAQIARIKDYLDVLPVDYIDIEKVEADDVISFLAQGLAKRNSKVKIISTDKDFLQLVHPNISVHNPVSKKTYTIDNVEDEIKVPPVNYLIAKALVGDSSDNLSGIKGLGIKTLVKKIPEILEKKLTLEDVYSLAEQRLDEGKIFARIIHDWLKVETNYNIMNLEESFLTDKQKLSIVETLKSPVKELHSGAILHYLEKDNIERLSNNADSWLFEFKYLTSLK